MGDIGRRDVAELHLRIVGPWAYVWRWSDQERARLERAAGRAAAGCMYAMAREWCVFECELAPVADPAPKTVGEALRLAWKLWRWGDGERKQG